MSPSPRIQGSPSTLVGQRDGRYPWPMGNGLYSATAELRDVLLSSASWHAGVALRQFVARGRHDLLQAAVSVGIATELLMKAYLAHEAPALVAEKGDRESVLLLVGHSSVSEEQAIRFKSIGGAELLKTFQRLSGVPAKLPNPVEFKPTRVRNAAAHMALVDSGLLKDAVTEFCEIAVKTIAKMGVPEAFFWGEDVIETVAALVTEAEDQVLALARVKIGAARKRVGEKLAGIPDAEKERVLSLLASDIFHGWVGFGDPRSTQHEEVVDCPACGATAVLVYEAVRETFRFDSPELGPYFEVTGYPFILVCQACDLELEDDELGVSPELTDSIDLDPDFEAGDRYLESIDL